MWVYPRVLVGTHEYYSDNYKNWAQLVNIGQKNINGQCYTIWVYPRVYPYPGV